MRKLLLAVAGIALAAPAILGASEKAEAQQAGRVFPYKWAGNFPADDVTTADIQHALIWTGHYGAMVDGAYGPYTRRAIGSWLSSKGYATSDNLNRAQAIELVTEGMKKRDEYGWATLSDSSVGFSVGIPTRVSSYRPPSFHDDALWYDSIGIFEHHVSVYSLNNACAQMDNFFSALQNLPGEERRVIYQARRDDWFVLSGDNREKRFYTRSQCRQQGIVTVVLNVPVDRIQSLGFLFTAVSNSLSLRPVLNPRAPATARIDPPPPPPTAVASDSGSSRSPFPMPPTPATSFNVDRSGKTTSIKLTLGDGQELRPQDVFSRVSNAVFVVRAQNRQGSAVAVSDHELLTNCHVVGTAATVTLQREGHAVQAKTLSANVEADRCVLQTDTILPSWAKIRPFSDIKVGERVYTIGAPRGLELSLADGMVSSKRALDIGRVIQTSAPISSGSSGGGLFDAQGNLIGITTFMLKDSQNLNFAIAAEEYGK